MVQELDRVILQTDLPEHGLIAGDLGTVVLIHKNNVGYEIEFFAMTGDTITVASVPTDSVRPVRRTEVAHVRQLVAA